MAVVVHSNRVGDSIEVGDSTVGEDLTGVGDSTYPYFLIEDDPSTWVTHEDLNGRSAGLGGTPAWKTSQGARRARGPGPPAHVAAPIRARMTPGGSVRREAGASARNAAGASASMPVQQPEVPDARMHPARAAQMASDVVLERGACSPLAPVQWSVEEEEAMREIEAEEAAATERLALVAARKAKLKARQPGPLDFTQPEVLDLRRLASSRR
ncbi:hypothetical protein B0H14DRAFT_2570135 [Mycena olivaceomarginata]|nr:hypothetical protein B0H14DRAFT_2570135 [Mycena olivaceomarginata]